MINFTFNLVLPENCPLFCPGDHVGEAQARFCGQETRCAEHKSHQDIHRGGQAQGVLINKEHIYCNVFAKEGLVKTIPLFLFFRNKKTNMIEKCFETFRGFVKSTFSTNTNYLGTVKHS